MRKGPLTQRGALKMKKIKTYNIITLLFLCLLAGCNTQKESSQQQTAVKESPLHSLDASTQIIMHLIEKQALSTVLEQSNPQVINQLVKNFSPAEIALEAEALNWPQPVVLFFTQKDNPDYSVIRNIIERAAISYESQIKFIEIDVDELFNITEQFHIDRLPALLLMHQRAEVARAEGLNNENFKVELQKLHQQLIKIFPKD